MVTRFSVAAQPREATHVEHEAHKVYGNVTRYIHNPAAPDHRGSVLSTRQRVGTADTVQLQPGNEASRTHVSTAVKLGVLVETAPGYFADLPRVAEVAPAAVPVALPAAPVAPVRIAPPAPSPHSIDDGPDFGF
jgi:hypothetical protein